MSKDSGATFFMEDIIEEHDKKRMDEAKKTAPFSHKKLKPVKKIGEGACGEVWMAYDLNYDLDDKPFADDKRVNQRCAIKVIKTADPELRRKLEQAEARQRNGNYSHIAPAVLMEDDDGQILIRMPYYRENGSHFFRYDLNERSSVKNGRISLDRAFKFMHQSAKAFDESHRKMKRVHGDPKLSNWFITDDGDWVLGDFADSRGLSYYYGTADPRDLKGHRMIRSISRWRDDKNPSFKDDVWSWGANSLIVLNGVAPLEELITKYRGQPDELEKVMRGLSKNDYRDIVEPQIERVPRELREILRDSLAYGDSGSKGISDGNILLGRLESEVIEPRNIRQTLKKGLVAHAKWGLWPIGAAGLVLLASLLPNYDKHIIVEAPMKIRDFENKEIANTNGVFPSFENITDLPKPFRRGPNTYGFDDEVYRAAPDKWSAFFAVKYFDTMMASKNRLGYGYTDAQFNTHMQYNQNPGALTPWPRIEIAAPITSAHVAISKSVRDGKLPVEEICFKTVFGVDRWYELQQAVGGNFTYQSVREAKVPKLGLSKDERAFLDEYISNVRMDLGLMPSTPGRYKHDERLERQ